MVHPYFGAMACAAVGVGLLLGFLGPFGTYPAFGRIERYAFWLGLGLTGYLWGFLAWKLVGNTPRLAQQPAPVNALLAGLLSAVPQTFMVFWALSLVQPGRTASTAALVSLFAAVTAVQLILLAAMVLIDRPLPPAANAKETQPLPPALLTDSATARAGGARPLCSGARNAWLQTGPEAAVRCHGRSFPMWRGCRSIAAGGWQAPL